MGMLKHFVLPVFCLSHAGAILLALTAGKEKLAKAVKYPGIDGGLNTWIEKHSLGSAVAIHSALLYNGISAMMGKRGGSRQRATAVTVELILFAVIACDGYMLGEGFDITGLVAMSTFAIVGLIVNRMEPGVFTKDKNKAD
jgi:hypothetical protein